MRIRSLAALAAFSGALLASGAAMATPTLTIDGVTIPTGIVLNGFTLKTTESSFETRVNAPGDILRGVTKVTDIEDNGGNSTYTYPSGSTGVFLVSVFDNFKVNTILLPTASTAGTITFTGGSLAYFVSTTNNFHTNLGVDGDILAAESGTPWLTLAPQAVDAAGDTLIITLPKNSSLNQFAGAQASAFLDVVGGDAGSAFNTNTFFNATTGLFDDVDFQGTANSNPGGDFLISGSNDLEGNAVPEPVSIALFGGGLAAMGALVRRRKAKKA